MGFVTPSCYPAPNHPLQPPSTQVEVIASTKETFKLWDGWVNSRLRTLVGRIEDFVTVR